MLDSTFLTLKKRPSRTDEQPQRSTGILVRDLRPSDFEDIVGYYYKFYDEVKEHPSFGIVLGKEKPSMNEERRWFKDLSEGVANGDTVVSVAEVDGQVVGMCEVRTVGRRGSEVSHRGDLGIAVDSNYRGIGVGSSLLGATLDKCKGKFENVELSVFSVNEGAKELYRRFGFKPFGQRPASVKRGSHYFDEDLMQLKL